MDQDSLLELAFLAEGGEMGAMMRAQDWAASPLGDPQHWPQPLKTSVELMLHSRQPMVVAWGPELTFIYNDAYIPLFGQRHPHMLGRPSRECWPEIWSQIQPLLNRALEGYSVSFDHLHFKVERNGYPEDAWFTFSYAPIRVESGAVQGVFSVVTETTAQVLERRLAVFRIELADELRLMADESWTKFRVSELLGRHLHASCAGYAVVDDSGEWAEVEAEWTNGLVPGGKGRRHRLEDYGSAYLARLCSGRVTRVNDALRDPLTASSPKGYAGLQTRAAINAPILRDGRMVGILYVLDAEPRIWTDAQEALIQEVAERTGSAIERARAQRAAALAAKRMQVAVDVAQLGTWQLDVASGEVMADARCRQICGLDRDAPTFTLAELRKRIHPEDWLRVEQALARAADPDRGGSYAEDVRWVHPDGRIVWTSSKGTTSFDTRDGRCRPVEMICSVIDNTERMQLIAALERTHRRKDEFLAMLAHELRNPLAPISTAAAMLKLAGTDARRCGTAGEIIERQVGHMVRLVDDLLDVSRVTRGLVQLERAPVDMAAVVSAAIEQTQGLLQARRHELRTSLRTGAFTVNGDFHRLVQVVTNLLSNAAKYTPPGGMIQVRIHAAGDRVVTQVSDNGVGMAAELLPQIFDLFTQGDRTPDRSQGGLGIGLALVRSIVQLHGGEVTADSPGPGQGSVFSVALPRIEEAPPPTDAGELHAAAGQLQVLVVDDNVDAAATLAEVLTLLGHRVATAYDGKSGLALASDGTRWDAFILDIGLPDMTGYDLARKLRELPVARGALFVAVTGYGQARDRELSAEAGFNHHLVKPVDLQKLEDVLNTCVQPAAARRPA